MAEDTIGNDETTTDKPVKLRAGGRPRKTTSAETTKVTDPDGTVRAEVVGPVTEDKDEPEVAKTDAPSPKGKLILEGEAVEVETVVVDGVKVAKEDVYLEHTPIGSKRKTYFLVARKGTLVK